MADDLKAMILAAGLGTRLQPHTDRTPKALYPVAGRPMILYPLLWLKRQGFGEVLINTFYLAEEIESVLGDGSALGIRLRYSREETLLGTGGGIGRARSLLGRHPMIVLNADTIVDVDLARLLERRRAAGGLATLALAAERSPGAYTRSWSMTGSASARSAAGPSRGRGTSGPPTSPGSPFSNPNSPTFFPATGPPAWCATVSSPRLPGAPASRPIFTPVIGSRWTTSGGWRKRRKTCAPVSSPG